MDVLGIEEPQNYYGNFHNRKPRLHFFCSHDRVVVIPNSGYSYCGSGIKEYTEFYFFKECNSAYSYLLLVFLLQNSPKRMLPESSSHSA